MVRDPVTLDPFDLRLLAALQEDGRLSNLDLAGRVGLSPSQCSRRRAELEARGLIRRYRAELDAPALGFGVLAFIHVTLARHSGDNASRFRSLMAAVPEIQEAYAVTGDADYVLKAVLPDLAGLANLVNEVLLPHGSIAQLRSTVVLERLKEGGGLPLRAG